MNQNNRGEACECSIYPTIRIHTLCCPIHPTPTETDIGAVAYSPDVNAVRAIVVKHFNEYPNALQMDLADLLTNQHTQHTKEMREVFEEIIRCTYPIGIRHPTLEVVDKVDIERIALARNIKLD